MRKCATRAATDLSRLFVPVSCPGCGQRDVRWCDECEAPWWAGPLRSESGAPRLAIAGAATMPVWALADLTGSSHAMMSAWKDGGRRDLDAFFAAAMRRQVNAIAPALDGLGPLAVVPVPSRPASVRRRGVDLPLLLARAVVEGLHEHHREAVLAPVLRIGRGEQRGASARQRWRQASALRMREYTGFQALRDCEAVVLVDDVLTTGATMAAATRALGVRFLTVCAGLCLAAAPAASTGAPGGVA